MQGPISGPMRRTDRVDLPVPNELAERLDMVTAAAKNAAGDDVAAARITLEAVFEHALGSEADWERSLERIRAGVPRAARGRRLAPVLCECCHPGVCRRQWYWRGQYRCQCTRT